MPAILNFSRQGSRFYDSVDGRRYDEIEMSSRPGEMRRFTVADAKKMERKPYPSTTTILEALAKPGLDNYKQEQVALACLTLPRIAGETEDSFAIRAIEDSKAHMEKAADFGNCMHELTHQWCMAKMGGADFNPALENLTLDPLPVSQEQWDLVYRWLEAHVQEVYASERMLLHHGLRVGGTMDLHCKLRLPEEHRIKLGVEEVVAVCDFKTRKVSRRLKKGNPKKGTYENQPRFDSYLEDGVQGACYMGHDLIDAEKFVSIYIARETAEEPQIKVWDDDETSNNWLIFGHLRRIYELQNGI